MEMSTQVLNDLRKAMWYLKFLENEIKKEDKYGYRGTEVGTKLKVHQYMKETMNTDGFSPNNLADALKTSANLIRESLLRVRKRRLCL